MTIELVGTRAPGITATHSLLDRLGEGSGADVAVASAYWDKDACPTAIDAARRIGGVARLLLWTAGSTRRGWEAARAHAGDDALDLRFINSPAEAGIFHAKIAGVVDAGGAWLRAMVGSANLTGAAMRDNLELGVLIDGEVEALAQLRGWFEAQWAAARPAGELDWERAIEFAPDKSEAAERKKAFNEAALAPPAPALPRVPRLSGSSEGDLAELLRRSTGLPTQPDRGGVQVKLHPLGAETVERATLVRDGSRLLLRMWPGELNDQVKALYATSRIDHLLDDEGASGWSVIPNPHVTFRHAGPDRRLDGRVPEGVSTRDYAATWKRIFSTHSGGKLGSRFFESGWSDLVDEDVFADDRDGLRRFQEIIGKERPLVRPGLEMRFVVRDDAEAVQRLRAALISGLDLLGESIVLPA